MFYFVKHGRTDYSQRNTKIYQGFGVNLSPLSAEGIREIQKTAKDPRLQNADLILTSPYTRALQTAAILSKELGAEIIVETDLHEWLANKNYIYEEDAAAAIAYREYIEHGGSYPLGAEPSWESAQMMRTRVLPVLEKYKQYQKVIVACHGMMIQAVTEKHLPSNGEIMAFEL